MITPIENAADLAEQQDISYGTLEGGSTMTFFRVSFYLKFFMLRVVVNIFGDFVAHIVHIYVIKFPYTTMNMNTFLSFFVGFKNRNLSKDVEVYGSKFLLSFLQPFRSPDLRQNNNFWTLQSKKPSVFVATYEDGIKRVLEGDYAFLMESTMLDYAVQRDCNLTQIGGK